VANFLPTKDCTAAMGYCMTIDYDTRVSVSPQPPQDGRWVIFVPASYKNMTSGEAQLANWLRPAYSLVRPESGIVFSAKVYRTRKPHDGLRKTQAAKGVFLPALATATARR
jgi:hypothetical protein